VRWSDVVPVVLAAAGDIPAAPVVALMALGVVLATVGHAGKDRRVVIAGLAVLFLATILVFVLAYVSFNAGDLDPRDAGSGPGGTNY
jgi:hypothetical protein